MLAIDLRVFLTVLLGRSQLLRQRIRTGRVIDVHACMDTLVRIDEAVRAVDARLTRLVDDHAATADKD
jgi:hypothetical protein